MRWFASMDWPLTGLIHLLPLELAELDAVGFDGGVAKAALLVGLVSLEVAFKPFDVAVAFKGEDMGGKPIEEEAIMADDYGAAGEIFQCRFES